MKTNDLHPDDYQFVVVKPDGDFNPDRNKAVIQSTIKKTRERIRKGYVDWRDKFGERAEAAASYLKYVNRTNSSMSVEKYFSKQYLAYLRGDDVRRMLMTRLSPEAWKNQRLISRGKRG